MSAVGDSDAGKHLGFVVRPASGLDCDHIHAVISACFPPGSSELWTRRAVEETLKMPGTCAVVAQRLDGDVGQIIGCAITRLAADTGDIVTFAVLPAARTHGVGAAMLETLMALAAGAGVHQWTLEVRADNRAAISLYRRFGFEKAGTRPGYYLGTNTDDETGLQKNQRIDGLIFAFRPNEKH